MIDVNKVKQKILDMAIRGELTKQLKSDGNAADLLVEIQKEKEKQNIVARKTRPYTVGASCASLNADNDSEMPFEIPKNWVWCKLGEVTVIERGGSPRPIKAFITSDENGTNWIKIGDVERNGKYITKVKERIIKDGEKHSRKVFPGDFLLTNSMSFGRPYISKIEGCIHDGWLVIRGNDSIYTSEYLYYYLSSAFAFNQFSESASGATVDNLSIDKVKSSWFSVPTIAEQKRIVEKVDKLFEILDKIDEAQKKYQKDKEILKSKIIEAGIRGKLTKQLKSDGNASNLLDEIRKEKEKLIKEGKIKRDKKETYIYKSSKDNLYYEKYQDGTEKCINDELAFEIPENWAWCKVGSAVENIIAGGDKPKNMKKLQDEKYNIPVYSNGERNNGLYGFTDKAKVMPPAITISARGTIGYTVFRDVPFVPIVRLISIISKHRALLKFINYYLKTNLVNSNGSTTQQITLPMLTTMLIPLPPYAEQERIVKCIEGIMKNINA